jgi:hypothetical protein
MGRLVSDLEVKPALGVLSNAFQESRSNLLLKLQSLGFESCMHLGARQTSRRVYI